MIWRLHHATHALSDELLHHHEEHLGLGVHHHLLEISISRGLQIFALHGGPPILLLNLQESLADLFALGKLDVDWIHDGDLQEFWITAAQNNGPGGVLLVRKLYEGELHDLVLIFVVTDRGESDFPKLGENFLELLNGGLWLQRSNVELGLIPRLREFLTHLLQSLILRLSPIDVKITSDA